MDYSKTLRNLASYRIFLQRQKNFVYFEGCILTVSDALKKPAIVLY